MSKCRALCAPALLSRQPSQIVPLVCGGLLRRERSAVIWNECLWSIDTCCLMESSSATSSSVRIFDSLFDIFFFSRVINLVLGITVAISAARDTLPQWGSLVWVARRGTTLFD